MRNKSSKDLYAEHQAAKAQLGQKIAERKRYGTRGVQTSKGLEVMFGYSDGNNKFYIMEPADYIKEIKEISGKVPVHELLLTAPGVSAEDREEIALALGRKHEFLKKAKEMVNKAEEAVIEDGRPVTPKTKSNNGGKKN